MNKKGLESNIERGLDQLVVPTEKGSETLMESFSEISEAAIRTIEPFQLNEEQKKLANDLLQKTISWLNQETLEMRRHTSTYFSLRKIEVSVSVKKMSPEREKDKVSSVRPVFEDDKIYLFHPLSTAENAKTEFGYFWATEEDLGMQIAKAIADGKSYISLDFQYIEQPLEYQVANWIGDGIEKRVRHSKRSSKFSQSFMGVPFTFSVTDLCDENTESLHLSLADGKIVISNPELPHLGRYEADLCSFVGDIESAVARKKNSKGVRLERVQTTEQQVLTWVIGGQARVNVTGMTKRIDKTFSGVPTVIRAPKIASEACDVRVFLEGEDIYIVNPERPYEALQQRFSKMVELIEGGKGSRKLVNLQFEYVHTPEEILEKLVEEKGEEELSSRPDIEAQEMLSTEERILLDRILKSANEWLADSNSVTIKESKRGTIYSRKGLEGLQLNLYLTQLRDDSTAIIRRRDGNIYFCPPDSDEETFQKDSHYYFVSEASFYEFLVKCAEDRAQSESKNSLSRTVPIEFYSPVHVEVLKWIEGNPTLEIIKDRQEVYQLFSGVRVTFRVGRILAEETIAINLALDNGLIVVSSDDRDGHYYLPFDEFVSLIEDAKEQGRNSLSVTFNRERENYVFSKDEAQGDDGEAEFDAGAEEQSATNQFPFAREKVVRSGDGVDKFPDPYVFDTPTDAQRFRFLMGQAFSDPSRWGDEEYVNKYIELIGENSASELMHIYSSLYLLGLYLKGEIPEYPKSVLSLASGLYGEWVAHNVHLREHYEKHGIEVPEVVNLDISDEMLLQGMDYLTERFGPGTASSISQERIDNIVAVQGDMVDAVSQIDVQYSPTHRFGMIDISEIYWMDTEDEELMSQFLDDLNALAAENCIVKIISHKGIPSVFADRLEKNGYRLLTNENSVVWFTPAQFAKIEEERGEVFAKRLRYVLAQNNVLLAIKEPRHDQHQAAISKKIRVDIFNQIGDVTICMKAVKEKAGRVSVVGPNRVPAGAKGIVDDVQKLVGNLLKIQTSKEAEAMFENEAMMSVKVVGTDEGLVITEDSGFFENLE